MGRTSAPFAAVLLVVAMAAAAAAATTPPERDFTEDSGAPEASRDYAVVTFTDPPTTRYEGGIEGYPRTKPERGERLDTTAPHVRAYGRRLADQHAEYAGWLDRHAPRTAIVRELVHVANAVVVTRNGTRPETLSQGPHVARVAPSAVYRPTMTTSVDLIGAPVLWEQAGRADGGAGIKVGVVDSGIDASHDFFACKDDIPAKVYASGVPFDPSNVLALDHGTHVAGTVGGCVTELTEGPLAGKTISGVAPGAELWDYNVFPGFGAAFASGGGAFSHDIAAALEDAVADGMDVVNMSLGGRQEGPHDLLEEAANATVHAGVVVVASAGNSGPGDSTVLSPGSGERVIAVGASTNSHIIALLVHVGEEAFVAAVGDFDPFEANPAIDEPLSDWDAGTNGDDTLACDAADDASAVAGTVTLIERGECTFTTKIRNAENAGAIGVVVYNNVAGPPVGMLHDGTDPFPEIPAVMVSQGDGHAILDSLPTTTTIDGNALAELPAQENVLAGFSSRGPTAFDARVKPDVAAPGVNIVSSVFDNGFASFQGTSMASPHVAGGVVLLLQQHPGWSPADVRSAVANTATRVILDSATATDDPGLLARGGGLLDLAAADATQITLEPVFAGFGESTGNKPVRGTLDVTVTNLTDNPLECSVEVAPHTPAIVSVSPTAFRVAGGAQTIYTVTLDAGIATTTPTGDYTDEVDVTCGDTTLRAPWFVRIDRAARP